MTQGKVATATDTDKAQQGDRPDPWGRLRAPNDAMAVFRFAMLGWYIGWYSKITFFLDEAAIHLSHPMTHPYFGGFRAKGLTLFVAIMTPMLLLPLLAIMSRKRLMIVSIVCALCSWIMLMHVASFNDATFTTSFWVSLWMLWLAWNCERDDWALVGQSQKISMMIVSLMFLGGFMGKMTPEFWSGEMFYNYFFLTRDILHYPWLRETLTPLQLRQVATWFSRFTVIMEGAMMMLWVLPFRRAAPWMIVVMIAVIVGSTPWLVSVFGCLIGMLFANYAWHKPDA